MTPGHILCQNTLFKLGLLCLHQTHELPPTCKDLHNMAIWNIRVQYQRTVMTAISKEPKMFKANRSTKGPKYAQYARCFFCRVPELKPDLHPRHKNAGFEPCTFSLLSRQHSNPNDLHANPHTHNASCHHHLGSTWFKGV